MSAFSFGMAKEHTTTMSREGYLRRDETDENEVTTSAF